MRYTRTCACCGAEYSFCTLDVKSNGDKWRFAYDSEMCRDIFHVLSDHSTGTATAEEVVSTLERYDVTDYSIFKPSIQAHIERVVALLNLA